jgi:ADP-heptose:LPS heptosyltransferase
MNQSLMRWIDRWLGVPACALLSLGRGLAHRISPPAAPRRDGARILFIELSEMGSMVAALPSLAKARTLADSSDLYFLTFAKNKKCLDLLGVIPGDNVLCIRDTGLGVLLGDMFRTLRRIRALRIDYVIDMEILTRVSALLTGLCGAKRSSGFSAEYAEGLYRGRLHSHPVAYNPYLHIGHNFLALIRAFSRPANETPLLKERVDLEPLRCPALASHPDARNNVRGILEQAGWTPGDGRQLVLVNPNGGLLPIRAWPLQQYAELIQRLLENKNLHVALIGIDGAVEDARRILEQLSQPTRLYDLTCRFRFEELIPLFYEADLLITNDGGPAHFASLSNCDILVFFGPETPLVYGPLSDRAESLYSHYACSPCLSAFNHRNSSCNDNQCLKAITVDEVFTKAQQRLANRLSLRGG